MKSLKIWAVAALFIGSTAWAGAATDKQLDNIQNSTGGSLIAVPSVGTAFATDTNTLTFTNKSMSGSSNTFTLIPASALTGQVGVANGGSGLATWTLNGVTIGNGTSSPTFVTCSTPGNVLTWNGTVWACAAPSSGGSSNVVGSVGSPQSITASVAVAVTGQIANGPNVVFVNGSAGPVTVTATPSITACSGAGEHLELIAGANAVTLQDNATLSGSMLKLNGPLTLGQSGAASYTASFICDATSGNWVELARY